MQQTLQCPNCGYPNHLGIQFCVACGVRMGTICPYCHATVDPNRRFCGNCGADLFRGIPQQKYTYSIEYLAPESQIQDNMYLTSCQNCFRQAPVKHVVFYQNIGMLIMRMHKSIDGYLCRDCINKYFWQFTLITFFLGWWGIISFFYTLFILPNNIITFLFSLSLPRP